MVGRTGLSHADKSEVTGLPLRRQWGLGTTNSILFSARAFTPLEYLTHAAITGLAGVKKLKFYFWFQVTGVILQPNSPLL